MAEEQSILKSIKKVLNVPVEYDVFDQDILMAINTVFSDLQMLGIGPEMGFSIQDDTTVWVSYLDGDPNLNNIKTYMGLRVRLLFDPPQTSYLINLVKEQVEKLEWLINVRREDAEWTLPQT